MSTPRLQQIKEQLDADPSDLDIRYSYAKELFELNELEEAEAVLLRLIKADPRSVAAYQLLAVVEQSLGQLSQSVLAIEQWLNIEPVNALAWSRLGAMNHSLGQFDRATDAYGRATELKPEEISHWVGLALSALSAQKLGIAKSARDYLCSYFAGNGITYLVDGHIHKIQGGLKDAVAAYEHALEICPNLASAIYSLVDAKTPDPDDPLTQRIERLSQQNDIDDADKANLNFSLGRIYEEAKEYDVAFAHYESANNATLKAMIGRGISYDRLHVEEFANNASHVYSARCFVNPIEPLPIDLKLIFIVGLPRSGTTLLEQILGSHSKVVPGGELPIAHACHNLYMHRRAELQMGEGIDLSNNDERKLLLEMREFYLDSLFELDLDGEYITDKLPGNFQILGFVRLLFPNAVIIHSRRNIFATCWSLYSSNFGLHDPYYNSMQHLAHYCRTYQELMQYWKEVLDPPIIDACYEDIVVEPEEEIRRLVTDVGLPWEEKCLAFHENTRPILTASCQQVRQPIYRSSIDRWRNFEPYLADLNHLLQIENSGTDRTY